MQDLLADGRWHTRAEVLAVGKAAVPPGVAYRRAVKHRLQEQAARAAEIPRPRPRDEQTTVEVGARRVANGVLRALVRSGKVHRDGDWYCLAPPATEAKEATG
jgi:hypothetical protein